MEYRQLGNTPLQVSRVGFGCWAMGGHGYGLVDDNQSIRAVQRAVDLGVNFFDTADVYGFGHSETILSKALGSQRHEMVLASKFGICKDEQGRTYKDCSPKQLVRSLEGSLRRLRVDSIPLYQLHWHDGKTPIVDIMEALQRCRDEGKVQYIGCCNLTKELIKEANKYGSLASIQALFNVVERGNAALLRYCFHLNMGSLIYGVLGRGLFTGKYDRSSQFGENDTRSRDESFKGEKLMRNLLVVDQLRKLGNFYRKSTTQVAVRWALDLPFVTCAIIGIKNESQVEENVGGGDWNLDPANRLNLDYLIDGQWPEFDSITRR